MIENYAHPQTLLFQRIKAMTGLKIVPEIMKILHIKKSAAYARMNGEINLSYLELLDICRHFDLSVDTVIYDYPENIAPYSFYSNSVKVGYDSYEEFIFNSYNHLKRIKNIPNLEITYICNEASVLTYVQFPHILALKMSMWDLMNWGIHKEFSEHNLKYYAEHKRINTICEDFYKIYVEIRSTEVWNTSMLQSTYKQLIYLVRNFMLKDEELIRTIMQELKSMIYWLYNMLSHRQKYMLNDGKVRNKKYEVYLSELMSQNEVIAASGDGFGIVYISYDAPNFIRSMDPRIKKHIVDMLARIKKNSIPLTKKSEENERKIFLKELLGQHEYFEKQLDLNKK